MGNLGEELKAARENKGLTLKDIADRTRISYNFLKALEEEDFSVIPGEVFVTGFLRTYARELGLKEKEVLARYKEMKPPPPEPQPAPAEKKTPAIMKVGAELAAKKPPLYLIVAAGLLLGAVITAVVLLMTPGEEPVVATSPPAQPSPVQEAFRPATTAGTALQNQTATAQPQAQKPPAKAAIQLKLTAEKPTWYSYKADKDGKDSGILETGKAIEVLAEERIMLDLGNAGGVRAELNGKPLKPFGKEGAPVKNILFTKDIPGKVVVPKKPPERKPLAVVTSLRGR